MEKKVVTQVGRLLLLLGPLLEVTLAELAHPLWTSGSGRASFPFAFLVLGAVTWQHTPPTGPVGLLLLVVGLAGREIVASRSAARVVARSALNLRPGF